MLIKKRFIVLTSVFLAVLVFSDFAVAEMAPTRGLTLSPVRTELEIAPGRSLDRSLKLVNYSDKPMTVRLSAEKFSVTNPEYDYAFTAESDTAKWVTFPLDEVVIEPGKSKKLPYTIGVPLKAEPGGRYISLFATTDTLEGSGGVKSQQRIASLIYLNVSGQVTRIGELVSLTSPWAVGRDSKWSMSLRNGGTTHFRSQYSVSVQNLIGGEVARNAGDALILPGTVRSIVDTVPTPQLPGVYRVVYKIGLGDTPAVTETKYIAFMPAWAIVTLVLIITLLIFALLHKRSQIKKST